MIHCLHGFLGSPRDWDGFDVALQQSLPRIGAVVKADLFGTEAFPDAASMPEWAEAYDRRAVQADRTEDPTAGRFLLGYSLGGRLALHLAVQFPSLWDAVVIVGANPGLDSADVREQRRRHDEVWARRFESEPWDEVLAAWDAQPVFAGRRAALSERWERDFSRARLADALRRWSLGEQQPLWAALPALPCPILWIAGAEDVGQVPICRRVRESVPRAETWVAPDAGHRVPWEQPQAFAARVGEFLTATQRHTDGGKR